MNVPEFLIARLKEQIEAAPHLREGDEPGGRLEEMLDRIKEGVNKSGAIQALRGVEAGARRYASHMSAAQGHLEPLGAIYAELDAGRGANYPDGEAREKAMKRLMPKADAIRKASQAAIVELQAAQGVMEEGDGKLAKVGMAR